MNPAVKKMSSELRKQIYHEHGNILAKFEQSLYDGYPRGISPFIKITSAKHSAIWSDGRTEIYGFHDKNAIVKFEIKKLF